MVQLKKLANERFSALICIDSFNERIRLDDYSGRVRDVIQSVLQEAAACKASKVIVKVRREHVPLFLEKGFRLEGVFSHYFLGSDAYGMSLFLTEGRMNSPYWLKEDEIVASIQEKPIKKDQGTWQDEYVMRKADLKDVHKLAKLYDTVFETYPTPMNEPDYIQKVMEEGTVFYAVEHNGHIVSAASAEINAPYGHAELTDCATLPTYRKLGFMHHLILALEKELQSMHIFVFYSLARALSYGMNQVFYQLGYTYTGRFQNNCYIFDKIEDMNLWVKTPNES
ncbi:putative beta-lysine N-acetyltransferase [Bacillus pumilus]|uniref:putative beta-lysine N-acetyltransferase n=1 Tax=Bacillus pumilus TaxID=1408 RepID=UPI000D0423E1|nr:putative beta-lysine N-acetyltransferase [Bacillus pumilus]PRS27061.1 putative beta-lysine N-acetyltransferase [Bacillus pumilus]